MRLRAIETTDNAALDRVAVAVDRQRPLRFKYRLLSDLSPDPPAKGWIIKNVIAAGETSAWIGPPGSLKSALLAEMLFAVASKQDWHGYKVKRSGLLVYFALERADLVKRRLLAYQASFAGSAEEVGPIAIISGMIDLASPATVKEAIASIRSAEEETDERAVITVWDTFAKLIAAGGGDENQAKDQGRVFANIQRIKDEIGCHAALIGHTGKDEARGARGSNAILGDVDLMVTISGELVKTATVTKANDAPEGPLFSFKSEVHEFGRDEDGDPITVNVVTGDGVDPAQPAPREPKLTTKQQAFFLLLHEAGTGLTQEEWNVKARENGIGVKRPADLVVMRSALRAKGLIREYGGRWKVIPSQVSEADS
jgi:hypothetical protein